jgi:hypothetical protein
MLQKYALFLFYATVLHKIVNSSRRSPLQRWFAVSWDHGNTYSSQEHLNCASVENFIRNITDCVEKRGKHNSQVKERLLLQLIQFPNLFKIGECFLSFFFIYCADSYAYMY